MLRKRDRDGVAVGSADDAASNNLTSSKSAGNSDGATNFGGFLWNDVSIVLFYRLMHEIHDVCLALVKAAPEARSAVLSTFATTMDVIWTVAKRHLTEEELKQSATSFTVYSKDFLEMLQGCVREAAVSGVVSLCRSLQRLLEEAGFPEAEFGPLSSYLAEILLEEDLFGYSYSERTSLVMSMPVRCEGDKRVEEEHTRRRIGFEVELPLPHPHPEINTLVQLSEPKRRKPALDEYRIFSLPKKAATFAADDFVVDEELLHRAYVVLTTHLDAYGSLKGLAPYARLLLWNLLGRSDTLFNSLYDQRVTSEATRQQLLKLRELLAVHKEEFEETRVAARNAASLLGWYAASAQWRDQALSKLEELEESDWYMLADVYRSGGKAIFPNYARRSPVVHLALGVVRKLDRIHSRELDGVPPMHTIVSKLLLPLMRGEAPELGEFCFGHGAFAANSSHWQRRRRKLRAVMDETARASTLPIFPTSPPSRSTVCTFLCASLIFPLQCFGELLELCSLISFSSMGFEAFTRSFLATNWEDEEAILGYLLRREPTNPSLVPLVGIPRVYKDMVTSVQLLTADKMVPYVVEARRLAGEHTHSLVRDKKYPYWKALSTMFIEEDRFDDLGMLHVSTKDDLARLYTVASFELTPKITTTHARPAVATEHSATDMDTESSQVHADAFSVASLSRLHKDVLVLREHLRSALLANSPQMEMLVYTHFYQLYKNFYSPFYASKSHLPLRSFSAKAGGVSSQDARQIATAEMRFVLSTYTQDFLAACLYLMNPASLPETYIVPHTPPTCDEAENDANVSSAYISAKQRRFCGLVFLYTCWSSSAIPVHLVLEALYPLLDVGVSTSPVTTTTALKEATAPSAEPQPTGLTENRIAANLFAQERFSSQKRLLSDTLTGLVLTRSNGVRALFCVLLLNDRVKSDMTREAAQLLAQLLTSPALTLWRRQHLDQSVAHSISPSSFKAEEFDGQTIVTHVTAPLSREEQVRLLAPQLLALLEGHADANTGVASTSTPVVRPRFLAHLDALEKRLPAETLEQRLHLGVTVVLNALLRLVPRGSREFAHLYRQAFYANKYVLTPGFGCLSLRRDTPVGEEDAIAALLRLKSLVKGVSLGAGGDTLTRILPPTAAGILNLCALPLARGDGGGGAAWHVSPTLPSALRGLLTELLANPSLYDFCAHAFVVACSEARPYSYVVGDIVRPRLCYREEVCEREYLVKGLQWLLFDVASTVSDFVHACVGVIVERCHVELFATGMETLTLPQTPRLPEATCLGLASATTRNVLSMESDTSPLVLLLERLALEATSEALFGSQDGSLISTLGILGRILGLSGVLYRWALGMMEHLLSPGNVAAHLDRIHPQTESHKQLVLLQRCAGNILSTLAPSNTSAQSGWAWYSEVAEDDAVLGLATRVQQALNRFLEHIAERLASSCAAPRHSSDKDHSQGETVIVVRTKWQHLLGKLQSALDCRVAVDVAVTLSMLACSVDDVVWGVIDPWPLYETTQELLQLLLRVLFEVEDVGAALRAIHCIAWLGMFRFDSRDSSYMAHLLWVALVEDHPPSWLNPSIEAKRSKRSEAASKVCRFRVRVLDILLSWTDYDENGRTLRNVDDSLQRTHHTSLYNVLVSLCHNTHDAFVQVAAIHFLGAYTSTMYPRVPISAICDLCRDVFRLSPHEMAKAACAAALGRVVLFLFQSSDASAVVLSDTDIENIQRLASAMCSYRRQPPQDGHRSTLASAEHAGEEVDLHDAVIQQHGREMLALLRPATLGLGCAAASMASHLSVSSLHV